MTASRILAIYGYHLLIKGTMNWSNYRKFKRGAERSLRRESNEELADILSKVKYKYFLDSAESGHA